MKTVFNDSIIIEAENKLYKNHPYLAFLTLANYSDSNFSIAKLSDSKFDELGEIFQYYKQTNKVYKTISKFINFLNS